MEILEDGYCILRPSSGDSLVDILPDELLALLKTLSLDSGELQKLKSKKKSPKPTLAAPEARLLLAAITSKLSLYATTVEQDKVTQKELSSATTLSTSEHRRKMAIEVRVGEKEILQQVSSMLRDFLAIEEKEKGKRAGESASQQQPKKAKIGQH